MKARIIFYGTVCAVVAFSFWFYHTRTSKNSFQIKTENPSHPQTQTAGTTRPNVLVSHTQPVVNAENKDASSAIDLIADERANYDQRLAAIRSITGKLTDKEQDVLYNFLQQRAAADDGQLGQVLKNSLIDALCFLNPPPPGLRELLAQIYRGSDQNIVLRDYAIQHLSEFYRHMANASDIDPQDREFELRSTREVLWGALNDTDSSIPGTALLGLNHLSQEGWPGFDQNKIGDAALKLAGDNSAGELSRITAFQVCASLGVADALPVVWGAAQQAETVPVQISAIAALGTLGGSDQIPFLNNLVQGNNARLKLPAQHALNQINQRLKQLAQARSS